MVDPSSERRVEAFVALTEHEFGIISQEQLDRGWQRIEEPLVGQRSTQRQISRPEGRKWRMWVAGFAAACAVPALALLAFRVLPTRTEPALRYVIEGPAASQGNAIASPSGSASRLNFSDQSRIDLGPSTNMTVEGLDARGARIGLVDGALDVYVKPRGNASWRFMAGPFRINVKGTAFHLAFAADRGRLTLQMKSGLVEVIAPSNRTISVGGNESLELYAQPTQAEAPPLAAPSAPSPVVAGQVEPAAANAGRNASLSPRWSGPAEPARRRMAIPTSQPVSVAWPKLLAKGDFADVIADAERRGMGDTIARANPSDLSALADAARYTKRYDLARQVLLAMRTRFAGADHARDASFFLGRLAEAVPDRTEAALGWYETYLREAPRGLYASEALGREMALFAPNAPERARKVAAQYLARFPHGPQSELARSLLEAE
jgi:ferric-dicitrate binding protein FerR (iron transport regulator)